MQRMPDLNSTSLLDQLHASFLKGDDDAATKQTELQQVRLLQQMYQAIGQGDWPAFAGLLHDDVEFEIDCVPSLPMRGKWSGRAQVAEAAMRNFGMLEQQVPEIESVIAQGDTVVVLGRERGNMRGGGNYSVRWMQMRTFRDSKCYRVYEMVTEEAGAA
jgi:uncharacterized protein